MVIPNLMGVAVWSPPLNSDFNSIKGARFLGKFAKTFEFNTLKYTYGQGLLKQFLSQAGQLPPVLLYAAAAGDKRTVKKLIAQGYDINFQDYDFRTALHLAAVNG